MLNRALLTIRSNYFKLIVSIKIACSIEIVEFTKLNGEMDAFMQKMDPSQNLVSQLAECIEGKFTNRQMAFMVSKITLVMMMAQAAKEDSNNEEE